MANLPNALQSAVQMLLNKAGNLMRPYQRKVRTPNSQIPGIKDIFENATQDFSPMAKERAERIPIRFASKDLKTLPFGNSFAGDLDEGAAANYMPGNGVINIGIKNLNSPHGGQYLRHELIHSMDTNVNHGRIKPGTYSNPQEIEQKMMADAQLADALAITMRYLNGQGLLDSRGFYGNLSPQDRDWVNKRTQNYSQDPRTIDLEGMAYMGTTGQEYYYPQYKPIIMGNGTLPIEE